jgi:hypothetical protein
VKTAWLLGVASMDHQKYSSSGGSSRSSNGLEEPPATKPVPVWSPT